MFLFLDRRDQGSRTVSRELLMPNPDWSLSLSHLLLNWTLIGHNLSSFSSWQLSGVRLLWQTWASDEREDFQRENKSSRSQGLDFSEFQACVYYCFHLSGLLWRLNDLFLSFLQIKMKIILRNEMWNVNVTIVVLQITLGIIQNVIIAIKMVIGNTDILVKNDKSLSKKVLTPHEVLSPNASM